MEESEYGKTGHLQIVFLCSEARKDVFEVYNFQGLNLSP